jgi:putative salt-induced outer membrane protein
MATGRSLLTAGANASSGNNNATTLNLAYDAVRLSAGDKWTWGAKADYASSAGTATTQRYGLGTQYNRDLTPE